MSPVMLPATLALALAGAASAQTGEPAAPPDTPVYTDDDLERYRREREGSQPKKDQPRPGSAATPVPGESAPAGVVSEEDGSDPRAAAAGRIAELRRRLQEVEAERDKARGRVEDIELRLNPMSTRFEVDPNTILALQAELPEARQALAQHEAEVDEARRALAKAESEARRAGVPVPR